MEILEADLVLAGTFNLFEKWAHRFLAFLIGQGFVQVGEICVVVL